MTLLGPESCVYFVKLSDERWWGSWRELLMYTDPTCTEELSGAAGPSALSGTGTKRPELIRHWFSMSVEYYFKSPA